MRGGREIRMGLKKGMSLKTVKLTLEYVGTNYCGWQIQPNGLTVQEVIEKCLEKITGSQVRLCGAGRTDSGVHAEEQVAHFRVETRLEPHDFQRGLNSLLPWDIAVIDSVEESPEFHAQFSTTGKRYRYCILNRKHPSAFHYPFAWFLPYSLDENLMKEASRYLIGRHDFAAFQASKSDVTSTVREITRLEILRDGDTIKLFFEGDGFLKHMVRIIVGTLVDFGAGRMKPEKMKEILGSGNRKKAGRTAPPHGLFLEKVYY